MLKSRRGPRVSEAAPPRPRTIAVELNFLPDQYRRRGLRILTALRPWLFLACFALLLIPSAQLFRRHALELATVEIDLAAVSETLEGYQPLADERSQFEARVSSAEVQLVGIQAAYDTINIRNVTWSAMVPLILDQVPAGVELTLVSQSDEEVVLEGVAESYPLPSVLADNLEALNQFETVTIQSVVLVPQGQPPAAAAEETPAADSGTEDTAAETPTDDVADDPGSEAESAVDVPPILAEDEQSSTAEDRRPPFYQFEISIFLPSFREPTPEPVDEG